MASRFAIFTDYELIYIQQAMEQQADDGHFSQQCNISMEENLLEELDQAIMDRGLKEQEHILLQDWTSN